MRSVEKLSASKMIWIFARSLGTPASLEPHNTIILPWRFLSDHPSTMNSGSNSHKGWLFTNSPSRYFFPFVISANVWGKFPAWSSAGQFIFNLYLHYKCRLLEPQILGVTPSGLIIWGRPWTLSPVFWVHRDHVNAAQLGVL